MAKAGSELFSGVVRPRACGLVVQNGRLLLVKINAPTRPDPFWMPPGGGITFGEAGAKTAEREVEEETGLLVKADELVIVSEYINKSWHALEFYYRCTFISGEVHLGSDPEIARESQMLEDVGWFSPEEMLQMPVFPDFIAHLAGEIVSETSMPLRYFPQLPKT